MPSDTFLEAIASQYGVTLASAKTLTGAGFTQAQVDAADACQFTVDTAAIRYTYDNTTPTASTGHPAAVSASVSIAGNGLLRSLQFIQQSAGALVNITLQKRI